MLIASSVVFAVPSSAAKDDPKYYTYYFGSEEDPEEFYFELAIVSYTGIVDGKRQRRERPFSRRAANCAYFS